MISQLESYRGRARAITISRSCVAAPNAVKVCQLSGTSNRPGGLARRGPRKSRMIFARSEKQYRPRATVIPDAYVNNCITRLRRSIPPPSPPPYRRCVLAAGDCCRIIHGSLRAPFKGIDEQLLDIQIRQYIPLSCSSTARGSTNARAFSFLRVEENRKSQLAYCP